MSNEEIDINKQLLSLLIIGANARGLEPAINYLTRRGWQTKVETNIKDALQTIGQFNPDIVLFSVNVSTPKLEALPLMIKKTFSVPVVIIGEKSDALTAKLINDIKGDFKLMGLPSGPGIHRGIKNILLELVNTNSPMGTKIFERKREARPVVENENIKRAKKGYTFSFDESDAANTGRARRKKRFLESRSRDEIAKTLSQLEAQTKEKITLGESIWHDEATDDNAVDGVNQPAQTVEQAVEAAAEESAKEIPEQLVKQLDDDEKNKTNTVKTPEAKQWTTYVIAQEGKRGYVIVTHSGSIGVAEEYFKTFYEKLQTKFSVDRPKLVLEQEYCVAVLNGEIFEVLPAEVFKTSMYSGEDHVVIYALDNLVCRIDYKHLAKEEKFQINSKDLVPELSQGSDMYIFLQKNNKYFLYVKERAVISSVQLSKLVSTETPVYINEPDFRKFREVHERNKVIDMIRKTTLKKAA